MQSTRGTTTISPPVITTCELVTVDFGVCRQLSSLLQSQNIPQDREEIPFPWMSPRDLGNFYLLLVAICHQTSPRGRPPLEGEVAGRHFRGWDYLSAKLADTAHHEPAIFSPKSWSRVTPEQLRTLFHDDRFGDRLTDISGRALLVQDLGQKMQD